MFVQGEVKESTVQTKLLSVKKILDHQGSGIHFLSGMVPTLLPDVALKFTRYHILFCF